MKRVLARIVGAVVTMIAAMPSTGAAAADNEALYFNSEISPPSGMPGCIEVQAKIKATRMRDPDPTEIETASRFAEILKQLPPAQTAAETVTKAMQARSAIPLAKLAKGGRNSGVDCLKSLDLTKQVLIIVTISIADRYACRDSQICSLPVTVTYAVCQNLQCRAEQIGLVGIDISPDVIDPGTTKLQSAIDVTLQSALSRIR